MPQPQLLNHLQVGRSQSGAVARLALLANQRGQVLTEWLLRSTLRVEFVANNLHKMES